MVNHTSDFFIKKYNDIIKIINSSNVQISDIITLIKKNFNLNDFIEMIKNDVKIFSNFLKILEIDVDLFNRIIKEININKKGNYKQIYCSEYKLILIFQMRNTIVKWKDLNKSIFYDPKPNTKYHYKSIHSQFVRWCNNDIFKNAFYKCVPTNNDDICINTLIMDDNFYIINDNNDLFIDATHINNKYGSENIIINPELKKKKVTKISAISNVDGFIYSISNIENKNKNIKFNYKNEKIKVPIHDSKTIQSSLKNINPNIKIKSLNGEINLIGDKGYITSNIVKYNNSKVNVITPMKKNNKNKFIYRNSKKMSYRYIIENTICSVKKEERINLRKDRKINVFMGWVYISSLKHNLKTNERINLILT
jgi:hypothetical protein